MGKRWVDMAAPWRDLAACRGQPTSMWYPERGKASTEADAICENCPVSIPCGEYGHTEKFGTFGGKRAGERRTARKLARRELICVVCDNDIPEDRERYCSTECALSIVVEAYQAAEAWRAANPDRTQLQLLSVPSLIPPIGPTLTNERIQRGHTIHDSAHRLGISAARATAWEEGRLKPDVGDVLSLAGYLQTSPARVNRILGIRAHRGDKPSDNHCEQVELFGDGLDVERLAG